MRTAVSCVDGDSRFKFKDLRIIFLFFARMLNMEPLEVENDDMEIQVGTSNDSGADSGFGEFRLQRVIDVQVNYEVVG